MNFIQSFKMAISAIISNKMRSFLTMLGVIIGVFAVVVLVSVVQGATASVTSQLEGMGTNSLTVSIMSQRKTIQLSDMAMFDNIQGIQAYAPIISSNVQVRGNNNTYSTSLYGTTDTYLETKDFALQSGRNINQTDIDNRFQVAVIGTDVANEIFGYTDVVGKSIRIKGKSYKIIGVVEEQTESIMGSANAFVIIPIDTAERLLSTKNIQQISLIAAVSDEVPRIKAQLEQVVEKKVGEDNYNVFSSQQLLDTLNTAMNTLTLMLGGIASISLLVGGIGIMNIMLVSVTERTREIGIRKAIGAKRRDILSQFLIEAIVVTTIGGFMAIGLSYVALIILGDFMSLTLSMSPDVIALGIGFCLVIGLVFGVYPANKASKLNPIEALRHE